VSATQVSSPLPCYHLTLYSLGSRSFIQPFSSNLIFRHPYVNDVDKSGAVIFIHHLRYFLNVICRILELEIRYLSGYQCLSLFVVFNEVNLISFE